MGSSLLHCFLELFNTFFSQLIPFLVVNCILTPYVFTGFFKHPFSSFTKSHCNIVTKWGSESITTILFCFLFNCHNYFFLSSSINASAYLTAAAESFFGIPRPVPLSGFEHHAVSISFAISYLRCSQSISFDCASRKYLVADSKNVCSRFVIFHTIF